MMNAGENGGTKTGTRSGRTRRRYTVSPANAAEKSLLPTEIPIGSIAVMNVMLVIGIGAERRRLDRE